MPSSDRLREQRLRAAVRDGVIDALGTVFWSVLAAVALLVGLQAIQIAFVTPSILATAGFVAVGVLVSGASLYLLSLLYWTRESDASTPNGLIESTFTRWASRDGT
ncbi:hypothetical protein [Haloplanus halobius]|uniref:hypothetical protein n=1 Tax=Haloplanus halobius TaxID=2934938 RepID=UPI0020102BC8|nr:hypothetical protein [Haloplanus sp. XH21]